MFIVLVFFLIYGVELFCKVSTHFVSWKFILSKPIMKIEGNELFTNYSNSVSTVECTYVESFQNWMITPLGFV